MTVGVQDFVYRHKRLRSVLSFVRRQLVRGWMYGCRLLPIDSNKAVFVNYYGRGVGDNGKAIAAKLMEERPQTDIVWAALPEVVDTIPSPFRAVKFRSMRYYKELATAKVWVDNSRKEAGIVKRKGQFYVQTWHGGVALKRIEKDAGDALDPAYILDAKNDSKMMDLLLSSCEYFTRIFEGAFWYDGEILTCGTPRMDTMFGDANEMAAKVKAALNIPTDKKVALYAPTFRANGDTDCYRLDFEAARAALCKRTGDDWVFAVRLHPNIADRTDLFTYSDTLINASGYPDLYELIPSVDLVLSDYSSLMFDASVIGKPVCIFATDVAAYTADRNFYLDLHSLPFPLATSNDELVTILENFDREAYAKALSAFNEKMQYRENGTASKTVVARIREVMD